MKSEWHKIVHWRSNVREIISFFLVLSYSISLFFKATHYIREKAKATCDTRGSIAVPIFGTKCGAELVDEVLQCATAFV